MLEGTFKCRFSGTTALIGSHFVCVLVHGRVSSVFVAADCRAFTIYMNGTLQFMSQYEGTLGWIVWFGRSLIPY